MVLRLVDPVINHVMCAHPFGDTTTYSGKNLDKTEINYEISDVTMLKIESTFNGDSAKATYA